MEERSWDLNRENSMITIVYMFKKMLENLKKKKKEKEKKNPNHPLADDQVPVETEQQVSEMLELPAQCCDSAEVLK